MHQLLLELLLLLELVLLLLDLVLQLLLLLEQGLLLEEELLALLLQGHHGLRSSVHHHRVRVSQVYLNALSGMVVRLLHALSLVVLLLHQQKLLLVLLLLLKLLLLVQLRTVDLLLVTGSRHSSLRGYLLNLLLSILHRLVASTTGSTLINLAVLAHPTN